VFTAAAVLVAAPPAPANKALIGKVFLG